MFLWVFLCVFVSVGVYVGGDGGGDGVGKIVCGCASFVSKNNALVATAGREDYFHAEIFV